MCGITGAVHLRGERCDTSTLEPMLRSLSHRGPDGSDLWLEGPAGLGHRRLAVLDLTDAAREPMQSGDGRFVLTYNGELYNYRELRKELQRAGCEFNSTGDAQVVLEAFALWGESAVTRFNGMFAFSVWDRKERTLFLARDRYGVKPLYYTVAGDWFLFASEIKAFLEHPSFRRKVDPAALAEYFTFQNVFTNRTLFESVSILPPGHVMSVNVGSPPPKPKRYWDYRFYEPERSLAPVEYENELDRLL